MKSPGPYLDIECGSSGVLQCSLSRAPSGNNNTIQFSYLGIPSISAENSAARILEGFATEGFVCEMPISSLGIGLRQWICFIRSYQDSEMWILLRYPVWKHV